MKTRSMPECEPSRRGSAAARWRPPGRGRPRRSSSWPRLRGPARRICQKPACIRSRNSSIWWGTARLRLTLLCRRGLWIRAAWRLWYPNANDHARGKEHTMREGSAPNFCPPTERASPLCSRMRAVIGRSSSFSASSCITIAATASSSR